MNPILVRDADPADIPTLAAVAERSYAAAFAAILEPDALSSRDVPFFVARFTAKWPLMRVALAEGRVAAFSLAENGHLEMLFVDPAGIGRGLGAALLRQVEAEGVRSLECFRDNAPARAFYTRQGWRLDRAYEREWLGRTRAFVLYVKEPKGGSEATSVIPGPRSGARNPSTRFVEKVEFRSRPLWRERGTWVPAPAPPAPE